MEEKTKNKYLTKFTPIQEKFIDNYCSKYGEISATQCAINAGYARSSAHTRAAELLDWKKHPGVCLEIQERLAGLRQAWDIDKDKHLAMLTKIRDEARIKGQYGVVAKCEELRGRVTGLYIEKSMVLTKEISEDEIKDKFKNIFDSPEEYIAHAAEHAKELWPDRSMKKAKKTKPK
jgi:phage terminase small subunit